MTEQTLIAILFGWFVLVAGWLWSILKKRYRYYDVEIWSVNTFEGRGSVETKESYKSARLRLCSNGNWEVALRQWIFSRTARFLFKDSGMVYRYVWISLPEENIATVQQSIAIGVLKLKDISKLEKQPISLTELSKKQIKKFSNKKNHYSFNE